MDYKEIFLNKLTDFSLNLASSEMILAEYIKNNYKKISFLDLSDVSKILGIDEAEITNYSNKLGYRDYEEFRKIIRDLAMSELSSTDRFEFSLININPRINNVKNTVIRKEIANLNKLMEYFDESTFYSILEELIKAPEIIVIGTRSSSLIAKYAVQMFRRIGKKTTGITTGATENFDTFSLFDDNTLILAIGFARYPKETIRAVSFFKKHNFKVVSITDNLMSALTPLSDIILTIPCESVSITDFYATPISVINMMIILLSQIDMENSISYLSKFEEIAKDYGFYF
ncbi:MAG: MurR/RpiR family transcriptional regulator [Eubacteriales bacterium]|nr:MurR/RpiR family transcriptional regulator [Eubacteriales bacterium]